MLPTEYNRSNRLNYGKFQGQLTPKGRLRGGGRQRQRARAAPFGACVHLLADALRDRESLSYRAKGSWDENRNAMSIGRCLLEVFVGTLRRAELRRSLLLRDLL